jgi:hypothetical protein
MAMPSTRREIRLVDGRNPNADAVRGFLYRDYPAAQLDELESAWASARESAVEAGVAAGLASLEHGHWDWRNKADSVDKGRHLLIAVEVSNEPQGVMAIDRIHRLARLHKGNVVYVDYVEAAPWNLKITAAVPKYLGVGTLLIGEAVRLSLEMEMDGAVGLHSLPQAEKFYQRIGMTRWGPDDDYYDLPYYEFASSTAKEWLKSIGEMP